MDFHCGFAVFELVGETFGPPWQLPPLTNRHKTNPEPIGDRGPKEKSAGVDADDLSDFLSGAIGHKTINGSAQKDAVAEDRSDVFEQNSRLGKIRHVAYGSA